MSSLYNQLFDVFLKSHRDKTKKFCQDQTNILWREIKDKCGKDLLKREELVRVKIKDLEILSTKKKAASTSYFIQVLL